MGLASGRHWQEIRGQEEREVWCLLPWLLRRGALGANDCLAAGKTTDPAKLLGSTLSSVLLLLVPGGGHSSWPLLTPRCFLSHLASLDPTHIFENGLFIQLF